MIKVEAIKDFKLARYDELKNIVRKSGVEEKGLLRARDTFECTKELCDYLMGDNAKKEVVVKVIEVIPEEKEVKASEELVVEEKVEVLEKTPEEKPKKKKSSKK